MKTEIKTPEDYISHHEKMFEAHWEKWKRWTKDSIEDAREFYLSHERQKLKEITNLISKIGQKTGSKESLFDGEKNIIGLVAQDSDLLLLFKYPRGRVTMFEKVYFKTQ